MEDCSISSGNIVVSFDDINAQIMKKAIEDLNKPPRIENVGVLNFDGTMAYTLKRAVYK